MFTKLCFIVHLAVFAERDKVSLAAPGTFGRSTPCAGRTLDGGALGSRSGLRILRRRCTVQQGRTRRRAPVIRSVHDRPRAARLSWRGGPLASYSCPRFSASVTSISCGGDFGGILSDRQAGASDCRRRHTATSMTGSPCECDFGDVLADRRAVDGNRWEQVGVPFFAQIERSYETRRKRES